MAIEPTDGPPPTATTDQTPRRRAKRKRTSRKHSQPSGGTETAAAAAAAPVARTVESPPESGTGTAAPVSKSRRRRRRKIAKQPAPGTADEAPPAAPAIVPVIAPRKSTTIEPPLAPAIAPEPDARKPKRRRRRKKKTAAQAEAIAEAPADEEEEVSGPRKKTGREMIINVTGGDECRIAILDNGRLEELFIERQSAESHVGNIYKGRITNVEPSIQAAFVDFGLPKNGFLHVSDIRPRYFPSGGKEPESVGKKVPRRDRPPIQKCFRRGQEVIVQITKEGVGTKGPTLTTYLSIPGRYLVMMPGMDRLGVSRKIEDDADRRKMRDILGELSLPAGMGFILRTAGLDRNKRDLQRDLNYLTRLWNSVKDRINSTSAPADLYQESDLVIRTLRDVYTTDFDRIVVDSPETVQKAREFLQIAAPRSPNVVELHKDPRPIFHAYGIEQQIDLINSRQVPLPSGGSVVIESTEAMVAIDVNSGRFRDLDDAEETAFKINMEAASEIARQLRLRDLGGLIVCDFIDMRYDRHKRAVERALRDELKKHKERARILRMSQFGLIEMTRQRQRASIKRSIYQDCRHCHGSGLVKTAESMSLEAMRILQLAANQRDVHSIRLTASTDVALMVLNQRRAGLRALEEATGTTIVVRADAGFSAGQIECTAEDSRGRPVVVNL